MLRRSVGFIGLGNMCGGRPAALPRLLTREQGRSHGSKPREGRLYCARVRLQVPVCAVFSFASRVTPSDVSADAMSKLAAAGGSAAASAKECAAGADFIVTMLPSNATGASALRFNRLA